MRVRFSFSVVLILLFALFPGEIQSSFFDKLPLEIIQNILVYATPETRIDLFSTSHGFTGIIGILKPTKMKKMVESLLRQNIFKGNFGKFDELDETVKNQYPKIILEDNPVLKNMYDKMWILYSFRYADHMRLGDAFEKLPIGSIRLKSDMFKINEQETYKIFQFTYQENDEMLYQTIWVPEFNLTSDSAWKNIKKIIEQFPKLERIIVNEIKIKENEIEKNYPLNHGNIIIQHYPKIEAGKPIPSTRDTLLHFPEMSHKIFKLLLESKVDPNVLNSMGDTPLHIASLKGKLDIVKLLLEYGADPHFKNNMDYTPADRVIWHNNIIKKSGFSVRTGIEETIKFWQDYYPATITALNKPPETIETILSRLSRQYFPEEHQIELVELVNNSKKYTWIIAALIFTVGGCALGFFKLQQYLSTNENLAI